MENERDPVFDPDIIHILDIGSYIQVQVLR
jgi:hypothetical protein